ncbi:MAG: lipoyl(octanoyl) transferase LipB [Gammaproteobacteria bacterium]|nr:lipoyl(octanoyl) transferase LipB [Gammaproteobacteria bacterium]
MKRRVAIRRLGLCHYEPIWRQMQAFTRFRDAATEDQIWLLQHHPVFTRGTGCRALPRPSPAPIAGTSGDIPVIHTDRGGHITYHGPGQLIAYLLLDIKRRRQGVKSLVNQIEQAVIDLLEACGLPASRRPGAPGVYLRQAKIAALGLRIKRGCCFHGLSLNVDMDLRPYQRIDPCGYPGLALTQMSRHISPVDIGEVEGALARRLLEQFG